MMCSLRGGCCATLREREGGAYGSSRATSEAFHMLCPRALVVCRVCSGELLRSTVRVAVMRVRCVLVFVFMFLCACARAPHCTFSAWAVCPLVSCGCARIAGAEGAGGDAEAEGDAPATSDAATEAARAPAQPAEVKVMTDSFLTLLTEDERLTSVLLKELPIPEPPADADDNPPAADD